MAALDRADINFPGPDGFIVPTDRVALEGADDALADERVVLSTSTRILMRSAPARRAVVVDRGADLVAGRDRYGVCERRLAASMVPSYGSPSWSPWHRAKARRKPIASLPGRPDRT